MSKGCDMHDWCTGQVRRLPIGADAAVIVCFPGFLRELAWRKARNAGLAEWAQFDLPEWQTLAVNE